MNEIPLTDATQHQLHPRNAHHGRYDFKALCTSTPELSGFLRANPRGDSSIDFSDADAVRVLNQALLKHVYGVVHWDLPPGYLCPPIPGRADYVHYLADLLSESTGQPESSKVRVLDIGTGASCIYPILASSCYGWEVVGSDIDAVALGSAQAIVESNPRLKKKISLRLQPDRKFVFKAIVTEDDYFDAALCNPPFYKSASEARSKNQQKTKSLESSAGLARSAGAQPLRNFAGTDKELWCAGGEAKFLRDMIRESKHYRHQVGWFTSLVSRAKHINSLKKEIQRAGATETRVVDMRQGHKISRFIAWTYHSF